MEITLVDHNLDIELNLQTSPTINIALNIKNTSYVVI